MNIQTSSTATDVAASQAAYVKLMHACLNGDGEGAKTILCDMLPNGTRRDLAETYASNLSAAVASEEFRGTVVFVASGPGNGRKWVAQTLVGRMENPRFARITSRGAYDAVKPYTTLRQFFTESRNGGKLTNDQAKTALDTLSKATAEIALGIKWAAYEICLQGGVPMLVEAALTNRSGVYAKLSQAHHYKYSTILISPDVPLATAAAWYAAQRKEKGASFNLQEFLARQLFFEKMWFHLTQEFGTAVRIGLDFDGNKGPDEKTRANIIYYSKGDRYGVFDSLSHGHARAKLQINISAPTLAEAFPPSVLAEYSHYTGRKTPNPEADLGERPARLLKLLGLS